MGITPTEKELFGHTHTQAPVPDSTFLPPTDWDMREHGGVPFSGLFLKKIDHVWWDHGIGAMRNADGFFRKWLAPRVDAAAVAAAEDPNGGALRAACPYNVAFHFEDDGDAFVLDFGGRQGPSLEYVAYWAMPDGSEGASAVLADLVLHLHSRIAWHGLLAMGGEEKEESWRQARQRGIFSAPRAPTPACRAAGNGGKLTGRRARVRTRLGARMPLTVPFMKAAHTPKARFVAPSSQRAGDAHREKAARTSTAGGAGRVDGGG